MAGRIALDLKQFKHLKSDEHTTTLQHAKDGHVLTLAHKALSPENQAQLQALAKIPKQAEQPSDKAEAKQDEQTQMAEGGLLGIKKQAIKAPTAAEGIEKANKRKDEGKAPHGSVIQVDQDKPKNEYGRVLGPNGQKVEAFSDGGGVPEALRPAPDTQQPQMPVINVNVGGQQQQPQSASMPNQPSAVRSPDPENISDEQWNALPVHAKNAYLHPGEANSDNPTGLGNIMNKIGELKESANQARQADDVKYGIAPPPPLPQAEPPAEPMNTPQPVSSATSQLAPAAQPGDMNTNPETLMQQGYQNVISGQKGAAQAEEGLAAQTADAAEKNSTAIQHVNQTFENTQNELMKEYQNIRRDVQNGHIDPERYWTGDPKTGEGGHSKIMAGIGMILGGFNPTDKPNAAIEYIHNQMDRNIKAQERNLGSDENLLSATSRMYQDVRQGTEMARILQNDYAISKLAQAQATAAGGPNGIIANKAKEAIGNFQTDSYNRFRNLAMMRSLQKLGNNPMATKEAMNQMMIYNPELYKEYQPRLVPDASGQGLEVASIPVPPEARQGLIAAGQFQQDIKNLRHFAALSTSEKTDPRVRQQAAVAAANAQNHYRQATDGGVFKQSEQGFIEKIIPSDPAQFGASFRTTPKLDELEREANQSLDLKRKAYGLSPIQHQASSDSSAPPDYSAAEAWASNPKSPGWSKQKADAVMQLVKKNKK